VKIFQHLTRTERARFPLGGKLRRIDQLHAGCDEQAAGAADHDETLDAGTLHAFDDGARTLDVQVLNIRLRPARIECAEHDVLAGHRRGNLGRIVDIGSLRDQRRVAGQLLRMTNDGGDLMATLQRFIEQFGANETAGADQCDFHDVLLSGYRWIPPAASRA